MNALATLALLGTLLSGAGFAASGAPLSTPDGAVALSRSPSLQVDELALGSREGIDDPVPLRGPWRLVSSVDGVRTWEAPSPVRPRTLFFHRPPDDMALLWRESADTPWDDAANPAHRRGLEKADKADSWDFSTRAIRVRRAAQAGPPGPDEYAVTYSSAVEREADLQRRLWSGRDLDFVQRSLQLDDVTRRGLLLPAPSRVSHAMSLPQGAVLDLGTMLLPPEAADPSTRSDGAELVITIQSGEAEAEVLRIRPPLGEHEQRRVDLSRWGGQQVTLSFQTDPGANSLYDYVFVTEPVVHVPQANPPRIALIFVDTLRPDHMSVYGYERPTTPRLDVWAEDAAIFEQARSVAPWTLPSSRTMLLGRQPELWDVSEGIHESLAARGWATAFFAGNVYLSSNFTMSRGWGTHRCVNWPLAQVQVDRALDWLDEHDDEPAFVLLHFMDMHLPYTEPPTYRRIFASDTPKVLGSDDFLRGDVVRAKSTLGEEGRQYVQDRYDNNLRYVDDQLARFLEHFDEDDLVLIVSDHGEEFWDHSGFEHGHTLYDELLRVPMLARGPGLPSGRVSTPTSLLDLAPTIAAATGLESSEMQGLPLQGVADGSLGKTSDERVFAFGRPLYGDRRWGSLDGELKYHSAQGKEQVFNLSKDPQERRDLRNKGPEVAPLREALADGLGRPVKVGYRLVTSAQSKRDVKVSLHVPGGVAWAYAAEDPTSRSTALVELNGDRVDVIWPKSNGGAHEVFVVPLEDAEQIATQLVLSTGNGEEDSTPLFEEQDVPTMDGTGGALYRVRDGSVTVRLTWAVAPGPLEEGDAVGGYNPEVHAELSALGYVEEEDSTDGSKDGSKDSDEGE